MTATPAQNRAQIFVLLVLLLAPSVSNGQPCPADDSPCLRRSLDQTVTERDLYKTGMEAAERVAREEGERAERWKKDAILVAPKAPAVWETPGFWFGIGLGAGFVVGALVTVGLAAATARVTLAPAK